jgi:hypothetical protein
LPNRKTVRKCLRNERPPNNSAIDNKGGHVFSKFCNTPAGASAAAGAFSVEIADLTAVGSLNDVYNGPTGDSLFVFTRLGGAQASVPNGGNRLDGSLEPLASMAFADGGLP